MWFSKKINQKEKEFLDFLSLETQFENNKIKTKIEFCMGLMFSDN